MSEEILKLGKLLVNELGLESSVDTLSRWMAHYIAEQMKIIDFAQEDEKKQAENRCFETILKLWKHMSYYNGESRPFEDFKPIFDTLNRMNPDNENPYYFQNEYSPREADGDNENNEVARYLSLATLVDKTARVWLKFLFQSAAEAVVDDKMKKWIEAALPLSENTEPSLIIRLLSNTESEEDTQENNIKYLERRIDQLEKFNAFSDELILMYKKEIDKLQKDC